MSSKSGVGNPVQNLVRAWIAGQSHFDNIAPSVREDVTPGPDADRESTVGMAACQTNVPEPIDSDGVDWANLGFNMHCEKESKMVIIETKEIYEGFHNAASLSWKEPGVELRMLPFNEVCISPCATCLNYGQALFEGIKAFRRASGEIVVFRPEMNARRMAEGARSLSMPPVPPEIFLEAVRQAAKENAHLVPPHGKGALYLRPLLYGSGSTLSIRPSTKFTFVVYASPVGEYFDSSKGGGAKLMVERRHDRAAPHGNGHVKAAGNYAPCFRFVQKAKESGFSDILYLDSKTGTKVDEVSVSNFFIVLENEIRTPKLGSCLEGVTRDAVIQFAAFYPHLFGNRRIVVGDITHKHLSNAQEAFCCGTGASISPIESISDPTNPAWNFKFDCSVAIDPVTKAETYSNTISMQMRKLVRGFQMGQEVPGFSPLGDVTDHIFKHWIRGVYGNETAFQLVGVDKKNSLDQNARGQSESIEELDIYEEICPHIAGKIEKAEILPLSTPVSSPAKGQNVTTAGNLGVAKMKTCKVAVLPGDGIGPEVMAEAVKVLKTLEEKNDLRFCLKHALIGGAAWNEYDDTKKQSHFPESTAEVCRKSDAVLFGSAGGNPRDKIAQQQPKWKDCEKNAVLGISKELGLAINLRPITILPMLSELSVLKKSTVAPASSEKSFTIGGNAGGVDILIVRDLLGGLYSGDKETQTSPKGVEYTRAMDVCSYNYKQIEAPVRFAFQAARLRRNKVCVVDKANVLDTSRLWRKVAAKMGAEEFPDVELSFLSVGNAAMRLVQKSTDFDVLVTENLFGDILSDLGSVLPGSLGMLPSASIGVEKIPLQDGDESTDDETSDDDTEEKTSSGFKTLNLYGPSGGSAPDIAGKDIANPIGMILSAAMMLRYSFKLEQEAKTVEQAAQRVLVEGKRTGDLIIPGSGDPTQKITCSEMGDAICDEMRKIMGLSTAIPPSG